MPRRVFLTGCTGQIGHRLTLQLLEYGYEVFGTRGFKSCNIISPKHTCTQVDLLNPIEELNLEVIKPDVLVHTSWMTTPIEFWESEQNKEWIESSKRIINEFALSGGSYAVVSGSCAEYSWDTGRPLSESSEELPASSYGRAKLELLNWLRAGDLPFLWTRTFFQFGMNEPGGRLIPEAIDSMLRGDLFTARSGSDIRDFVYVKDVARIMGLLISDTFTGVVNIGSGAEVQVQVMTNRIAELIGRPDLLHFTENDIPKSFVVSNPDKLHSLIGKYRWTSLEMALLETIEARKF